MKGCLQCSKCRIRFFQRRGNSVEFVLQLQECFDTYKDNNGRTDRSWRLTKGKKAQARRPSQSVAIGDESRVLANIQTLRDVRGTVDARLAVAKVMMAVGSFAVAADVGGGEGGLTAVASLLFGLGGDALELGDEGLAPECADRGLVSRL